MKVFNQLVLSLESGELKIQLNASNYEALSLTVPINRIENNSCPSSPSASFGTNLFWHTSYQLDESVLPAANDPIYDLDFDFGRLEATTRPPKGRWPNLDKRLSLSASSVRDRLIKEFESWLGRERFHRKRFELAMDAVLANLCESYISGHQLLLNMGNSNYCHSKNNADMIKNSTIKEIVHFLDSSGYIYLMIGIPNQFEKIASWCVSRSKLVALFEQTQASVRLAEGSPLAVVRERPTKTYGADGKVHKEAGAEISFPSSSRENARLRKAGEVLVGYTETWCDHTATLHGRYVAPWLVRIFIENTLLGGRFYGDYQNLPKAERDQIFIDGEPTVELDFKSLHYAMMYALAGIQMEGDPYVVKGFSRQTIKLVSLILANTSYLHVLKGQITQSGKPENQMLYPIIRQKIAIYNEYKKRGLVCEKPYIPNWYDSFIEGVPTSMTGDELVSAIQARHPAIADQFGRPDIGLKLQYRDSQIMAHALSLLSDVPVLPVHDSIRCKVSDKERVREAMLEAGRVVLKVDLVITEG